jgi:hypothetical protein
MKMPIVEIVKPNNTPEEEEKALERIADVLGRIVEAETGVKVKYTLKWAKDRNLGKA